MLNDKRIRKELIRFLSNKNPTPKAILEELHIDNGRAIADVVAAYNHLHCYEIKGQTDSIQRVLTQAIFYNTSFSKITLVTTKNHIAWALKHAPFFWGLILAEKNGDDIRLKYVRKTGTNSYFKKENALMMLWKEELIRAANHFEIKIKKSHSRFELAEILSKSINKDCLLNTVQSLVSQRKKLSKAFDHERNMGC
ncbi:sce7726 family protein [Pantoea sp. paga]|uniref:sce7726 family protein n=1 Tax=Pantoea sp. paga TaxID=2597519 RepID=UPI00117F06A3|nr:sce7726 family protein [Pantoea sp. paga]TSH79513.1 sce7726 family protein [Pantoea sp. paga]